jgi:2,4-dienoyl-CoA reductase-like NADH-dependent reductase (Old Yellow Enzyme family)
MRRDENAEELIRDLRKLYTGIYIANGDYDASSSAEAIVSGHADAVATGRGFIANRTCPNDIDGAQNLTRLSRRRSSVAAKSVSSITVLG